MNEERRGEWSTNSVLVAHPVANPVGHTRDIPRKMGTEHWVRAWERLWAEQATGGFRFVSPLLLGPLVGGVSGGLYGLLCDLLHMLLRWDASLFGAWLPYSAEAGLVAGAIVGVCQAIERIFQ
jgi:hypothetical protein